MKKKKQNSVEEKKVERTVTTTIIVNEVNTCVEPLNKKGLARILGVSTFILSKMLESCKVELGEPTGTMYCIKQVQYMVNRYGLLKK